MDIKREDISKLIGKRIQRFRTQRNMSQETLALAAEIHPAYFGRVERGERCPTVDTLFKISQGLKVPLAELLDISAEIKPTNTQALERIKNAMLELSEEEAVEVAEIVEKIIHLRQHKP